MGCVATSAPARVAPVVDLPPEEVIFGTSAVMGAIRNKVERAANANIPVFLQGQSGTGKEILARLIHRRSPWGNGPFVKVNCPAVPGTLFESELFGYEKGAFTGAYGTKPGRIELAHRGTLFLDEIAELEPAMQAKLLQLLQDGQFCRIGAQGERQAEVRIVCATNRQLEQAIKSGTFRQDLFYRINVVTMELPTLQERRADIPMLLNYFLEKYSQQYHSPVQPLPPQQWDRLLEVLQKYRWPGNIRELENLAKCCVILGWEEAMGHIERDGDQPAQQDWQATLGGTPALVNGGPSNGGVQLKKVTPQTVKHFERGNIFKKLGGTSRECKAASPSLSISYPALLYKMKEAGLPLKRAGKRPKGKPTVVSDRALAGDAQMARIRPGRVPLFGK